MLTILSLALIGGTFIVAVVRAHILRAQLEQDQRVRCELDQIDFECWEQGR